MRNLWKRLARVFWHNFCLTVTVILFPIFCYSVYVGQNEILSSALLLYMGMLLVVALLNAIIRLGQHLYNPKPQRPRMRSRFAGCH